MDVRTPRVFQFDALEERVCLSASHVSALRGSVMKGTLKVPVPPGTTVASPLSIEGNGSISPLGPVSALGTLSPSMGGVIDLASGDGGLVVSLSATTPHGHATKSRIPFTIIGGTGTFTQASGAGTAVEETDEHSSTITLQFHGTLQDRS